MSEIKDSGARTEYSTGAVRDIKDNVGRCDLLPLDVIGPLLGFENRKVICNIGEFMKSGKVEYLYSAIEAFAIRRAVSVPVLLLDVSMHYKKGAEKYQPYNWQKGIPLHSYIDSAVRHFLKMVDKWDDEPHADAFVWNILGAIWTMENKADTELIDIPFDLLGGVVANEVHACSA